MSQILGMVFHPCSSTEEDNEKVWKSSEFYTDAHFMSEYRKHIVAMQHVAACAKIYITNNWKMVTDWSELKVIITAKQGVTEYYNYVPKEPKVRAGTSAILGKMRKEIENEKKAKHNPIKEVTEVVLDPTDGDFSITINGKEHWWIDDESVIIIADYIEKQIKPKENVENTESND